MSVFNARVTERVDVAPGLMILRVAPEGWALPAFRPGQFAVLGLPAESGRLLLSDIEETTAKPGTLIRRSYSIASSSRQNEYLEFFVTLVRSGELSPRLFALEVGASVWLGPKITGLFTLDDAPPDAHIVLVATGTGLAPYMSMLRTHLAAHEPRRYAVIHGARHSWDLGYRAELSALARTYANLSYLPSVSRPAEEQPYWSGPIGRVQDVWELGTVANAWGFAPQPGTTHVFLCGNPAMITEMIRILTAEGFTEHVRTRPGQIHTEKFW